MKICVVGTGYVGLVTSVCLADVGNEVIGVDKNADKIELLRSCKSPIFEANIESLLLRNMREGRLRFTRDLQTALRESETCFICVDTPTNADEGSNLTNIVSVATEIGRHMDKELTVILKSTVPIGTTLKVKNIIREKLVSRGMDPGLLSVAYNPEFLKEGDAVRDFLKPDRVVVGAESEEVIGRLRTLFTPFMIKHESFIGMDIPSAELTKYASNSMLATRISFMNELARLAEKVGADISKIRKSMGLDPRIGSDFLYAGLGYGGSCLPKDLRAIKHIGTEYGVKLSIIESVDDTNEKQKEWFWKKIEDFFKGALQGKKMAIWGGAFKANTDDIRYSPTLHLIDRLLDHKAAVALFDPVAMPNIRNIYAEKIRFAEDPYDCLVGSDALVLTTEWNEFRSPDFDKIFTLMRTPVIFDGRNVYHGAKLAEKGFKYFGVGVPSYS